MRGVIFNYLYEHIKYVYRHMYKHTCLRLLLTLLLLPLIRSPTPRDLPTSYQNIVIKIKAYSKKKIMKRLLFAVILQALTFWWFGLCLLFIILTFCITNFCKCALSALYWSSGIYFCVIFVFPILYNFLFFCTHFFHCITVVVAHWTWLSITVIKITKFSHI